MTETKCLQFELQSNTFRRCKTKVSVCGLCQS